MYMVFHKLICSLTVSVLDDPPAMAIAPDCPARSLSYDPALFLRMAFRVNVSYSQACLFIEKLTALGTTPYALAKE
jgi:hypothetical protein